MKPKRQHEEPELFRSRLDQILNPRHPLYILANQIDWSVFEKEFGATYVDEIGRPGNPVRLMVGLHYLKYTFNESDESVMARFVENPYWQYFCGFEYFQHESPIDSSSLTRFRKRVGPSGFETLFKETVETAKRGRHLTKSHLNKVNIDTTVQEKAIAFPTDARLYHKMRNALVRAARARDIKLRQTYTRVSKKTLIQQGRYSHARQLKRARKATKRLKTMLGCVYRDILRKTNDFDDELKELMSMADRLLKQKKDDKNKLYSIHAPEVECISKGKVHKRYEFGCKVGMATTSRDNWIVAIHAVHGNPYDGHTLPDSLERVKEYTGWSAKEAHVDLGYRGHLYQGETLVNIVDFRHIKRATRAVRKWFKRRAAIEPVFGHLKSDNRMSKNYLKGTHGDEINVFLCACGFNLRKLLAVFLCLIRKMLLFNKFDNFCYSTVYM